MNERIDAQAAPPNGAGWVLAPTEERNEHTLDIDLRDSLDMLRLINDEDARVADAVRTALPALAAAVDLAVAALQGGHRIHYFGAGTSGRIAVLDAAELVPTYALDPTLVVAHHAGGARAFVAPIEEVEDDENAGVADAADIATGDVAIGLTASGRTPYVVGALRESAARGAATVLISANPASAFGGEVDVHVGMATGPEVIAGSTRMKAGTAQKLALNALSTAVMVRMGRTYSNLMVAVAGTNAKLRGRVVRILVEATGLDTEVCLAAANRADGDCRVALVSLLGAVDVDVARHALAASKGAVRPAVAFALAEAHRGRDLEVPGNEGAHS